MIEDAEQELDIDGANARRRAAATVRNILKPRLERAERAYGQALTSLWVGNAGAALATLSFIGATWKTESFPKILVWPFGCFVLGIIFMGIGAAYTIFREWQAIERMQRAESVLDLSFSDIESPSESIGLSLRQGRTIMAVLAGACFVVGCLIGFGLLAHRALGAP